MDGGDADRHRRHRSELRETARDYGEMPIVIVKAGRYEEVLTVALRGLERPNATSRLAPVQLRAGPSAEGGHSCE